MSSKKRVLVFASGGAEGGGSGFVKMVEASRGDAPVLDADIVGVISNHQSGGVRKHADRLGVEFATLLPPFTAEKYQGLVQYFRADFVMLSGWLKLVKGLDVATTINIHPGPLPLTRGLHGSQVHERVIEAFRHGETLRSMVTMHFVDETYDTGPVFFAKPVVVLPEDTADTLQKRVNQLEHEYQSKMLNEVIQGRIALVDGKVVHR